MGKRRYRLLDRGLRRKIVGLAAKGYTYRDILAEVDTSSWAVCVAVRDAGGLEQWAEARARRAARRPPRPPRRPAAPDMPEGRGFRLSLDERVQVKVGLELRWAMTAIAAELGRSPSTVCREVAANGGRAHYRPYTAHRRAERLARRPRPRKLAANPALRRAVVAGIKRLWSPEQVAHHLRATYPDGPEMWVSHETIYQSLYVQGRGELRKELAACLRQGRAKRKPQGRLETRGHIPAMVMISERPPAVEDRAVPGHWEGDLLIGKDNASAIGTLVERASRFVVLLHLPDGYGAERVRQAMAKAIRHLPEALRGSITWDQGKELTQHLRFTVTTGVPVYFCDPRSPWQRGSNENTNGLLRQYFPKGTDLSVHSAAKLRAVAKSLNGRPRETLGWMTPSEKLAELLAMAA